MVCCIMLCCGAADPRVLHMTTRYAGAVVGGGTIAGMCSTLRGMWHFQGVMLCCAALCRAVLRCRWSAGAACDKETWGGGPSAQLAALLVCAALQGPSASPGVHAVLCYVVL
jgi:hypothetical protein